MQPLGENLVESVEQAQAANPITSKPSDTTPLESIKGGSTALSSSYLTPSATLVHIHSVQKLEAQKASLMHHIQPWMHRSIAEVEERLERKMVQHTERKIVDVH